MTGKSGQAHQAQASVPRRVVAEYPYVSDHGELVFVKVRYEPKDFRVKRPDRRGGWSFRLGNASRVLYRLPEVIAAVKAGRTVYIVEGEKDADRLADMGECATCNFDGPAEAGKRPRWRQAYGDVLRGADVVVIADRDEPGITHARAVATNLGGKAKNVVVKLPAVMTAHADVSDHLDAGLPLSDLKPLPTETVAAKAPDDDGERGSSQATVLARLAEEHYRLLASDDGRPYAVKHSGPNVALLLRAKGAFRAQLARIYADEYRGRVPTASALTDALTVLEGRAAEKDPEPVYLRLAWHEGHVVLDLGTADGRCALAGPGGWSREPRSPVLFRRTKLTSPIPDPVRDGDGLDRLRNLINAEEKEFRLIVGWLIAALIPDLPHPIMALRGEQGSAKSSTARMLADLIDPSPAPLRSVPRDLKQWAVSASASWAVALDNVSVVPGWLSDTLCKAVTGDGYVDRVLYSDDDVTVLAFRRVILMTSIDPGALAGDLAERLLVIELNPIPDSERRPDAEVKAAYADSRPAILASLLDLLALVLGTLPGLSMDRMPRMADFARVLNAVDAVQRWTTLDDYLSAATDVTADVLGGDVFANAVIALANRAGEWQGTATELLAAVVTPDPRPKEWPKDATRASGRLKRLATALRAVGIEVTETRSSNRNRTRLYRIEQRIGRRPGNFPDPASVVSAAPGLRSDLPEPLDAEADVAVRASSTSARSLPSPVTASARTDADRAPASTPGLRSDLPVSGLPDATDAVIRAFPSLTKAGSPTSTYNEAK